MASLSLADQINALIGEALLVMSGVEGSFIRVSGSKGGRRKLRDIQLVVNGSSSQTASSSSSSSSSGGGSVRAGGVSTHAPGIDKSIADQITNLLPICEHAYRIREFIRSHSQYYYGLVSHALTAEIKTIIREFDVLISHLEEIYIQGKLSLQKLLFMLQPSMNVLKNVSSLCASLDSKRGGDMLNSLYTIIYDQGDAKTRELFTGIFYQALKPLISMLEKWLLR